MAKRGMAPRGNRGKQTADWFRMGVVSATMLAPLIARWNDLRLAERATRLGKEWGGVADEQTRDLRRAAAERAREMSELAAKRSQQWAELGRARANEWRDLVADRAGEWGVVATDRAHELSDQALALSDDLLALGAERAGELRKQAATRLEDARQQFLATKAYDTLKGAIPMVAKLDKRKSRRLAPTLWVVGTVVGLAAAGVAAYLFARSRLAGAPQEPLVELPQTGPNGAGAPAATKGSATKSSATKGSATKTSGALSGLRAAAEQRGIENMSDITTARDANVAPIVGNLHTMVYHDATDSNLPTEENRIYFASEAEARARGFRPARPTAIEHNQ